MNKWMRGALIGVGSLVGLLAVTVGGFGLWATMSRDAILAVRYPVPNAKDVPVPWPLTDAEIADVRAQQASLVSVNPAAAGEAAAPPVDLDVQAIAMERALKRGEHLVNTIYGCTECHGADFGGHVVVESAVLGAIICPNITAGKGSVRMDFLRSDWDRIVRHGVRPDGSPTAMPALDFQAMSDRELSDIIAYVQSFPPVDRQMDPVRFGPLLTVLLATGEAQLSAPQIDHTKEHLLVPPETKADLTFGEHQTRTCQGCHGKNYSGGPIKGGDPSWPPAANLTQVAAAGWTEADFARVMREGKKKDGSDVRDPMPWKFYQNLSDVELKAMWMYVQSLPPVETGVRQD